MSDLGFEVKLPFSYNESIDKVTAALKTEGFGVLTHIDVQSTLKQKIGEDFRPYAILGACNPKLAHRALSQDANMGLMLPCNVTVEATEDGGALVRIVDPASMLQVGTLKENAILQEVASEARARLERVAKLLAEAVVPL